MKYKVLLAEDERNLRNIVRTFLTQNDFEVDTANDGEEAIFAINKNVYDIIILDIMMPKKDGIEVCKYIRSKYDVPVIFLTALNQEKDIVNGMKTTKMFIRQV